MGLLDRIIKKSDQTRSETDLIDFLTEKLNDRRHQSSRLGKEARWLTNIAYLLGYDQVFYDPRSGVFRQVNYKLPLMRSNKVHTNKILPAVQNRVARLCKNPPRFEVPPNSMDQEDKDAARLSEQVLNHHWDRLNMNDLRIELQMWAEECGYVFGKICWDDMMGELIDDDAWEGDFRCDIATPFEVFEDPGAKSWREVRDIFHCKIRHLSYFSDNFEKGHLVEAEDTWINSLQYQARIEELTSTGGTGGQVLRMKDSAVEVMYYERPSKTYKKGRHVTFANGILLRDGDLPGHTRRKRIPFVKFDCVVIGGKFASESTITHAIPAQDQINRHMTLRAAFANRTLYGKFLAAKGHGMGKTAMSDQSGEIVEYTDIPNHPPPQALPPPILPQYTFNEHDLLSKELYDIMSTGDVSRGQLPAAGLPAQGMEILLESDTTRLGLQTEKNEHAYADLASLMLEFTAEYYDTERLLAVAGKDLEYTVRRYTGQDLKNHIRAKVRRGSTIPDSKVLNRQEILNAFDRGLYGDPNDPLLRQKVLAAVEFGDINDGWKDYAMKKAYVRRLIDTIENAMSPEEYPSTSEHDDHQLIYHDLNQYRISDKFLKLQDFQKQMVLDKIEEHVQHIMNIASPDVTDDSDIPEKSFAAQSMAAQMGPMSPDEMPMEEEIQQDVGPGDEVPGSSITGV